MAIKPPHTPPLDSRMNFLTSRNSISKIYDPNKLKKGVA